jgi:hypothetical protein
MANTYDVDQLAEEANQVRLLISDTDTTAGKFIFDDKEIAAFLSMEEGVLLAAARAFEVIAGNEILVQKRIKILDLSTDGPSEAKELRALAKEWRDGATAAAAAASDDLGFDIAQVVYEEFGRREDLLRRLMSGA